MMAARELTDEQTARMLKGIAAGESVTVISAAVGWPKHLMRHRVLAACGVKGRWPTIRIKPRGAPRIAWEALRLDEAADEMRAKGFTLTHISERLGVSSTSLRARLRARGILIVAIRRSVKSKWTDDKDRQLQGLWNNGLTVREIGKVMDTSPDSVIGRVHRLRLAPRPSPIRRRA